MGDDITIHQHPVRIVGIEQVAVEGTVVVINHGQPGAGSISGYHCGNDHHPFSFVMSRGFGGIDGGPAADPYHHIDVFRPDHFPELVDFPYTGDASEHFVVPVGIAGAEAFFQFVMAGPVAAPAADEQPVLPQILEIIVEFLQGSTPLYIFQRCTHETQSCHSEFLLCTENLSQPEKSCPLETDFCLLYYTIKDKFLTIIIDSLKDKQNGFL
ncbi:unknown [Acidaminococcus sp. CAG:542]|nr:unknown [Acidaminococcus sp. CAG:542]